MNHGDTKLSALLLAGQVPSHPFIVGEIALGNLKERHVVLDSFRGLPRTAVANDDEILAFIEAHQLYGRGIGYVDVHLLAATRLTGATLWTRYKRLAVAATLIGLAFDPSH